jgi:hypothetical protein
MDMRLVISSLVALAGLAGCATPAVVGEYPNQHGMIGRSKASVLACAGAPIREDIRDGTTLLLYYREAPVLEESAPVGKGSFPTIRHGCWATVVIAEDNVREVRYRFVPAAFDAANDCEAIFEACLP